MCQICIPIARHWFSKYLVASFYIGFNSSISLHLCDKLSLGLCFEVRSVNKKRVEWSYEMLHKIHTSVKYARAYNRQFELISVFWPISCFISTLWTYNCITPWWIITYISVSKISYLNIVFISILNQSSLW